MGRKTRLLRLRKNLRMIQLSLSLTAFFGGDDFYRCVKKYTAAQPEEDAENFIHTKYGYCYWAMQPNKIPIIFNLYTEPKFRRKGHAREHLQYIIKEIRNTGYAGNIEIEGPSFYDGVRSQWIAGFYKSMGLAVIKGTHK